MKRSRHPLSQPALQKPSLGDADIPTIASLGVRLVPVESGRERQLATLIASCEILRDECERLVKRIADLLEIEAEFLRDDDLPFHLNSESSDHGTRRR